MSRRLDLTNKRFGRLIVMRPSYTKKYQKTTWECVCDCGVIVIVKTAMLRNGKTRSCGCLNIDTTIETMTKHGYANRGNVARLYKVWSNMKGRCNNPNSSGYHNWGGRGISVCDEWQDFKPFKDWALKNGYCDILEIDRIDNDGNYEPLNCRFVTHTENARNRQNNKLDLYQAQMIRIKYITGDYTYQNLADEYGISDSMVWSILQNQSWMRAEMELAGRVPEK